MAPTSNATTLART